nr:hypothetical protein [Tanacetum cinerariifolium]
MWKAIERLKHGESIDVQDLKTSLYWEFGKFRSRVGESLESYYSRANQDNSPRINRGTGYESQRIGNVIGTRETVEDEVQVPTHNDVDQENVVEETADDVAQPTSPLLPSLIVPPSPPHQSPRTSPSQVAEGTSILVQQVLDKYFTLVHRVEGLESANTAQQLEILKLKARVKKLERLNKVKSSKLRRLKKVGTSQCIESSEDEENVKGRQADSQAEIYNIDLDHTSKVLSMQEDSELQEVIPAAEPVVAAITIPISAAKPKGLKAIPAAPTASTRKRKGVVIRDPEEELHDDTPAETQSAKDKGKCIFVEDLKPMKKKDQIAIDAEYARKLQEEEESLAQAKYAQATDVQPKDAPAKGIQYIRRYHGYKQKPQSESQARKNMIDYLKNTKEEIIKSINETPAQKAAKRRRLREQAKEAEDLKKQLEVVADEDDDVFVEATPIGTKVPVVNYEIVMINNKPREDLEDLWKIMKARFSTSKPTNWTDDYLLATLKNMFEKIDAQDRDDTDDESKDQELKAHYMYMEQIQKVTPDAADDSGPIFNTEPLQKDDDDDLANERYLLASLIEKLKCEINDSKNRNKLLETSNKVLVDKLKGKIDDFKTNNKSLESSNNCFKEANNKLSETNPLMYKDLKKFQAELDKRNDVKYASKVEIDCAKAKGDLISYKMESQKSFNTYTQKINDLNHTISKIKKELSAHQETIYILSQAKEARIKLYKTRKDKELDKVIALENKVKVLDNIVYKTGQSVQTMNMLNSTCKTSFAKLEFLKKAQRANPRLYDIGCYNDNLALMLAPESDEVIRLEKESRSKLSDLIRPFDYEKLNNLYDLFVPQREKSSEQRYFSERSKMSHTPVNNGNSKEYFNKQTTLLEKRMDESILYDQKCKSSKELFKIKRSVGTIIDGVERCKETIAKRTYFGHIDPFIQNTIEANFYSLRSQLETQKTQFLNEIDRLSGEYYYADHMNAILGVYTELDEVTNLQYDYLEMLEKCECFEKELSKSKMISNFFEALQKHAINLELDLQQC